jgi:hypothetical protein
MQPSQYCLVDLGVSVVCELLRFPGVLLLETELYVPPGARVKMDGLTFNKELTLLVSTGSVVDLRIEVFSDLPGREELM